ncbi:MAG: 30S ribosomal protein S13 [Candidatus Woesearchaeota archaeon]
MADNQDANKNFRHIVRVANTDLDGSKALLNALTKIKGVNFVFANALCTLANMDKKHVTGQLSQDEVARLDAILAAPLKYGFPTWMMNRRKDSETGADRHVLGADLTWQTDNDIKIMKKVRTYKGVRHMSKLPVRGQRTKNNFRNKRGKSLGVQRKGTPGAKPAAKPAGKPDGKPAAKPAGKK